MSLSRARRSTGALAKNFWETQKSSDSLGEVVDLMHLHGRSGVQEMEGWHTASETQKVMGADEEISAGSANVRAR